jgi:UDP-N-acetylmuramate--alanine ligase
MNATDYDASAIRLPPPAARVHFVGVGGVGVSGLARMLHGRGYRVSGSDASRSPITDELAALGIAVQIGHAAALVAGADYVVATAAARDDNPELVAARAAGLPVVKRAALLAALANDARCLAVAGTHGKSTTSGMAALALERAGYAPSFAVGATVRELGANARLSGGPQFVVEADEYDYSFLWLRPQVAIVTNLEHDHPDIFPDRAAVLDAFARFAAGIRPGGSLVLSADDPGCKELLPRVARADLTLVTVGETHGDWRVTPLGDGYGRVEGPAGQTLELRLAVPGRHNLLNALTVLAAASALGVRAAELLPGLAEFGGVGRRFECVLDSPRLTVIDDYAHHPTEVAATIAAARERYPDRRLLVLFQPHTYSRTKLLLDEFAQALDAADVVLLADIYRSRETDTLGVSSADIAARMTRPALLATTPDDAARQAARQLLPGDVALVLGAGDIYRAAQALAQMGSDT